MAYPGIIHTYAPGLVAFEHLPPGRKASEHKLLFVAGLGDGLFTVPYLEGLLRLTGWGLIEVVTSSSYKGWGTGSVTRDVAEISKAIEHFRRTHKDSKLVLMGHSTGSQDTLQYLMTKGIPHIDGAILQAPVSDREAIVMRASKTAYLTSINFSESWIKDGRGKEIIPTEMRPGFAETPVCAERWYSLAAPLDNAGKPQGAEDFFSSDLDDETLASTFGKLPKDTLVMVLYSGSDEFVPVFVDKEKLVNRWRAATGGRLEGGVIKGATHNLGGVPKEVVDDLVGRVGGFLKSVSG